MKVGQYVEDLGSVVKSKECSGKLGFVSQLFARLMTLARPASLPMNTFSSNMSRGRETTTILGRRLCYERRADGFN
jgi:hypothetical protein